MVSNREAVLKTLLYSDIFNYPLKKEEIFFYLLSDKKLDKKTVLKSLESKEIEKSKGFYFLKGRKSIVNERLGKEDSSSDKLKKAQKAVKKIKFLPSIKFIGISGALSMKNSDENDDIDFFVITDKDLVWTTRFILVLLLLSLGVYRKRNARDYSDKICLNMVISDRKMSFNENLYNAHEIIQMIPVFERDQTYKRFIETNSWTNKFMPNSYLEKKSKFSKRTVFWEFFFLYILKMIQIEKILGFFQLKYMKRHITKEKIREGFLGFHPFDYGAHIGRSYTRNLKRYKLLK